MNELKYRRTGMEAFPLIPQLYHRHFKHGFSRPKCKPIVTGTLAYAFILL